MGRSPLGLQLLLAVVLGLMMLAGDALAGPTLDRIKARGAVACGINPMPGYGIPDGQGHWSGIMVDLCRAMAAASLGDANRIEVLPVESQTRFTALNDGTIDLLVDGATVTLERETSLKLNFPLIWLYDGQGFMAHRSLGLKSIREVKGATICTADGTTSRRNVEEFIRREKLNARLVVTQSDQGAWLFYLKGRCDIFTNDHLGLLSRSALDSEKPQDNILLPDIISKEPLSPVVRNDDAQWEKLVRWTLSALIAAEEHDLTAKTVGQADDHGDLELQILTGRAPDHAESFGVSPGWARRAIEQVGNYGEIFDRHFGKGSPMKGERGLNALWSQGGLIYAPPLQ